MAQINKHILLAQPNLYFESSNCKMWVEGLFFLKGHLSGIESIRAFELSIINKGILKTFNLVFGNFTCALEYKDEFYIFCDNSGFSNLFYTDEHISSSFLRLITNTPSSKLTISTQSVFSFIYTGHFFTEIILYEQVSKIQSTQYIRVKENIFLIEEKDLFSYYKEQVSSSEFMNSIKNIVKSTSNQKISMDLTGGSDSRLLTALFNYYGGDFETAVSGVDSHPDITISTEVAMKLNKQHHISRHEPIQSHLSEELQRVFEGFDGMVDVLSNHRLYDLYKNREKRKIDIMISGSGGELYKDAGWWRRALTSSLKLQNNEQFMNNMVSSGLVNWGASSTIPNQLLGTQLIEESKTYFSSLAERLMINHEHPNRFVFADRLFYEYSTKSPRYYSQGEVRQYSPLLERELVNFGVRLPSWQRISSSAYRAILSKINSSLCLITTTKAETNLHSSIPSIIKDQFRMIAYVLKNRSVKPKVKVSSEKLYNLAFKLPETKLAIELLKELGLLNVTLKQDEIPNQYLGRILTLSYHLRRNQKSSKLIMKEIKQFTTEPKQH